MRLWPAQVINGDTGEICMNVASMSPFLKLSVGRAAYRCKECAEKAEGAQGGDRLCQRRSSVPLGLSYGARF